MNDSRNNSNLLEQQLTQATAKKLPAGVMLEGEAAELRQTWQAFGQLLDSENSTFDPSRLIAAVRSQATAKNDITTATSCHYTSESRPTPRTAPAKSPWPWQIVTLLALVAAIGWIWFSAATAHREEPPVTATPETAKPATSPQIAQTAPAIEDDPEALYYLGWEDEAIGTALDTAAAGLQAAAEPAPAAYHEADWLQQRFQQFQQDLSNETL